MIKKNKVIVEKIGITHSSTLRLREKQEERGIARTLWQLREFYF